MLEDSPTALDPKNDIVLIAPPTSVLTKPKRSPKSTRLTPNRYCPSTAKSGVPPGKLNVPPNSCVWNARYGALYDGVNDDWATAGTVSNATSTGTTTIFLIDRPRVSKRSNLPAS
jgi:hypothetical protein